MLTPKDIEQLEFSKQLYEAFISVSLLDSPPNVFGHRKLIKKLFEPKDRLYLSNCILNKTFPKKLKKEYIYAVSLIFR